MRKFEFQAELFVEQEMDGVSLSNVDGMNVWIFLISIEICHTKNTHTLSKIVRETHHIVIAMQSFLHRQMLISFYVLSDKGFNA